MYFCIWFSCTRFFTIRSTHFNGDCVPKPNKRQISPSACVLAKCRQCFRRPFALLHLCRWRRYRCSGFRALPLRWLSTGVVLCLLSCRLHSVWVVTFLIRCTSTLFTAVVGWHWPCAQFWPGFSRVLKFCSSLPFRYVLVPECQENVKNKD